MKKRLLILAFMAPLPLVPSAAWSAPVRAVAKSADARMGALYEAEWAWERREFGQREGESGESEPGGYLPHVDAASELRRLEHRRQVLAELDRIPFAQLSAEQKVNAAVFRTTLEASVANGRFRGWEMSFNSDSSFWSYLNARQGYRTADDYRRYLGRMRDIPRYFDEQIANLRAGLRRGFTVPKATLAGRDASIATFMASDLTKNPFYTAFVQMPRSIPAAEQAALRAEGEKVIEESVIPAYARLLAFLRDEYVPGARTTIAAEALPDGKAYYAAQIREYTTLDLTADQIHQIGLGEVARIQAEMERAMRDSGFKGSLPEFLAFLKRDPQFYAKTPDELLGYSAYVAKRVDGKLKDYFWFLPRYRFAIIPVPEAIAPFYTSGRGGLDSCQMNTNNLPARPLYQIPALTLHECVPGHSFQAALALEQPDRPAFRRQTYFSGYGEGWGLYCEYLGEEMGIYRTPYERFGRLSYEMWRAARLVIDTGIHSRGWSRQQAIDYLASHTALSQLEVMNEVDRYISWPGQALAYKLGEMTIRRLRADAERALGPRFDIRYFHDTVLETGSVPLPVLEQRIRDFIAGGGRNPRAARATR